MMSGKEKLYFLLNRIEDARVIAPSGKPILIHPANDLNNKYSNLELMQLFSKLEQDERVIKILKIPSDPSIFEDPYKDLDVGCYALEILNAFDDYFLKIQQEPEYQEFTGRRPASNGTKQTVSYNTQRGELDIEGKKVRLNKDSFRAKLLELLLKDDKSRKKEWSWNEVIEEIEETKGKEATKENKKKFYPACDGLSKFIAQKTGINDLLIFNKSTVQVNPKYL